MKAQAKPLGAAETRRLAEAKVAEREAGREHLPVDEARLLHELQVHQIELEMQNEALQVSRAELEAQLQRYSDLYDFAPVGYLTFESDGTIRELNLAAAGLLAAERARLVGRRFGVFVAEASRSIFSRFLDEAFATKAKQTCEVDLAREGHPPLAVKIEATPSSDGRGCRAIVTDLTERKRAEEELVKAGALQSAIFNSANFSSIATDAKGVIQIFNVGAERMLGHTAAEVMNKITPADISDPQELVARAKALSVELGTTITPGFEALVFKALESALRLRTSDAHDSAAVFPFAVVALAACSKPSPEDQKKHEDSPAAPPSR